MGDVVGAGSVAGVRSATSDLGVREVAGAGSVSGVRSAV